MRLDVVELVEWEEKDASSSLAERCQVLLALAIKTDNGASASASWLVWSGIRVEGGSHENASGAFDMEASWLL